MKDAVVVLGMHRSGTSATAGALTQLGAAPPLGLVRGDANNPRGYFESWPIIKLNDEILSSGGSSWSDWRPFNPSWSKSVVGEDMLARASSTINDEFQGAPLIVLKDPRMCRLAPLWFNALAESGYRGLALIVVRNPLEVAASLKARDGFSIGRGLLIWMRHVLDAEAGSRNVPRAVLSWPQLLNDWRGAFEQVARDLDLSWPRQSDFVADDIDAFFSGELRHHRIDDESLGSRADLHEWAKLTYESMLLLSVEPSSNSARTALDEIRRELDKSARLYGPAFSSFERDAERLRSLRAQLVLDVDQTHADRGSSRDDHPVGLEDLQLVEVAVKSLQSDLAQARGERDEARLSRGSAQDQLGLTLEEIGEVRTNFADSEARFVAERASFSEELHTAQVRSEWARRELDEVLTNSGAAQDQLALALEELNEVRTNFADSEIRFEAERTSFSEELYAVQDQLALALSELDEVRSNFAERASAMETSRSLIMDELQRVDAEFRQAKSWFVDEQEAFEVERAALLENSKSEHERANLAIQTEQERANRAILTEQERINLVNLELNQARSQFAAQEEVALAQLELTRGEVQSERNRGDRLESRLRLGSDILKRATRFNLFRRRFKSLEEILDPLDD